MERKGLKNPIRLFYILVGYVVVQFVWWMYLIFSLYEQTFDPVELKKKTWMLVGEGSVFLIILLGGVFIIRRALKREREINDLQQNFLQSVSHELKTPLASVGLFLETLQKRELDEEKRQDIYARSLTEVKRLNHLISDILTARNIESENYFVNKTEVQLDEYLRDKVKMIKETLLSKYNVSIETVACTVSLDTEALDSIIYNLLENAGKYSQEGSNITLSLTTANDQIFIRVADEGIGMDDKAKENAFNKFYRVENETTRKTKGTGLGLYITKFLVEEQGGKIFLKDNQPKGLIVEIQF